MMSHSVTVLISAMLAPNVSWMSRHYLMKLRTNQSEDLPSLTLTSQTWSSVISLETICKQSTTFSSFLFCRSSSLWSSWQFTSMSSVVSSAIEAGKDTFNVSFIFKSWVCLFWYFFELVFQKEMKSTEIKEVNRRMISLICRNLTIRWVKVFFFFKLHFLIDL